MLNKDHLLNHDERILMGKRLQTLIDVSGLKKYEVAKAVGIKPCALSHYLYGDRQPSDETLVNLSILLKSRPSYILYGIEREKLFRPSAVKKQTFAQSVATSIKFWNNLSPVEKVFIFISQAPIINFFRGQIPGGLTFEKLSMMYAGKIPDFDVPQKNSNKGQL